MCGIAGIVGPSSHDAALLSRMGDRLIHRGPDDDGIWSDPDRPVGFSHRRLSILDLSPAGHQPMLSADGRWAICYNGEIYNHADIRTSLDPAGTMAWRGHSDTETLVEAVSRWGVAPTLDKIVGMFALALLDRREGMLHLIRDRFGEKPLYYGMAGRDLLFASELKVFHEHPDFSKTVDMDAVSAFVSRGFIAAPRSIFRDVKKLPAGHWLQIRVADMPGSLPESVAYWSYTDVVRQGLQQPFNDRAEALDAMDAALRRSIHAQAVADVPVGTFLSGGIDSSLITAVYQNLHPGRVNSFTIGFDEAGYDESHDARRIADHLGTNHHELRVSSSDAMAVIPTLAEIYDEPFGDSSQIPTLLVSRMARKTVTVALSGDGGDELFGGYNRYTRLPRLWSLMTAIPRPLRRALGNVAGAVPESAWNGLAALGKPGRAADHIGAKMVKFSRLAATLDTPDQLLASFLNEWSGYGSPLASGPLPVSSPLPLDENAPLASRVMLSDALQYLPGDILCKVDRAAMSCSLETRVPFLDHRLATEAARIPVGMNIAGSDGKQILRDLLARYVPRELFERPKAGFAIPIGRWMRTDLRPWAEDLLSEQSLRDAGVFDVAVIRSRWSDHLSGRIDASQAIWSILMCQSWRRHWRIN